MFAHVDYVTSPNAPPVDPLLLIREEVARYWWLLLIGGVALVGLMAWAALRRTRWPWEDRLTQRLDDYWPLLPWMLRLSVGLPLIGAGLTGQDFVPDVHQGLVPPRVLAWLGFLLLLGLMTRAAALVALVLYVSALVRQPHLAEAFEYSGLLTALTLTGSGHPSADDLLVRGFPGLDRRFCGRPVEPWIGPLLRAGLGGSFVYVAATEKLLEPGRALEAVAKYHLTAVIPIEAGMWVLGVGLVELALGVVVLAGLLTRPAAAAAFGVLTLTFFLLPDDPVLAHVTLFGGVSAILVTGAGRLSLDALLQARTRTTTVTSRVSRPAPT